MGPFKAIFLKSNLCWKFNINWDKRHSIGQLLIFGYTLECRFCCKTQSRSARLDHFANADGKSYSNVENFPTTTLASVCIYEIWLQNKDLALKFNIY